MVGGTKSFSGAKTAKSKQASLTYPSSWYQMLAAKTTYHERAWDVGTGNGQAALGVAEYYSHVVATDIDQTQLNQATKHPKVTYRLTPVSMSEDQLVALIGGENSVDLVIVAQALHYFDLPKFYAVVKRVLRKPGGVIGVWVFSDIVVPPPVDRVFKRLSDSTIPFRSAETDMVLAGYKTVSFPFKSVGIGSEGNPLPLDLPLKLSLDGFFSYLASWPLVVTAKQQGVDLLPKSLMDDFKAAWGSNTVKTVVFKFSMIAGKCKSNDYDCPFNPPKSGEYGLSFPFRPPFPLPSDFNHMPPPPFCNGLPPFGNGPLPPPPFGNGPPHFGNGPSPFAGGGRGPPPPWLGRGLPR